MAIADFFNSIGAYLTSRIGGEPLAQQFDRIYAEASCDTFDNRKRGISAAAFDLTEIAVRQVYFMGERFERQQLLLANTAHISPKSLRQLHPRKRRDESIFGQSL